ncbi:MAG: hypothetical protein WAU20_13465, partial [Dokdonella sp.]
LFGTQTGPARRAYARFVAEGGGDFEPEASASAQVFLGDDAFIARATRKARAPSREVPRRQRAWTSLAQIERAEKDRDAAIRKAYVSGVFTLAQMGAHFGLHYASVSRIARQDREE